MAEYVISGRTNGNPEKQPATIVQGIIDDMDLTQLKTRDNLEVLRDLLKDEKKWADHYFERLFEARALGYLPDNFEF